MGDSTFDRETYAKLFGELRSMPHAIMEIYLQAMLPFPDAVRRVIDVGAGTGQFAISMAKLLPNAIVEALEPSTRMYETLAANVQGCAQKNIVLRRSALGDRPCEHAYDLVLASEVVHLFKDPVQLMDDLVKLAGPGGCIAIRTSSQEQLRRRGWYRFFPRARLIDMGRHPPIELLCEALRHHGFLVSQTVIDESRAMKTSDFERLISERMFSTLDLVGESDFVLGCGLLRSAVREADTYFFDYEMTLILGRELR